MYLSRVGIEFSKQGSTGKLSSREANKTCQHPERSSFVPAITFSRFCWKTRIMSKSLAILHQTWHMRGLSGSAGQDKVADEEITRVEEESTKIRLPNRESQFSGFWLDFSPLASEAMMNAFGCHRDAWKSPRQMHASPAFMPGPLSYSCA